MTNRDKTPETGDGNGAAPVAVALKHDRAGGAAPRVVATGRGAVAEQILQIAFDHGIRVRQDTDLAEVLAAIEMDNEIPIAAFAAVAEILNYVYRLNAEAQETTTGPVSNQ